MTKTFELERVEPTEVIAASSLEIMQRAEIDVQIATAHRFPRSMASFQRRALSMATIDEDTAESCLYRRPVGKDKNGKQTYAEGMSVRMAEIVGASYGNLRVYATIIEQTERQIIARGMAIDLESNFASSAEVVEATVKRDGKPYDERMRVVIAKAALAKARRDATFQVVPRALAKPIEAEVRRVLCGDAKTIERRREAALAWANKSGIDAERVFLALGIKGEADLGAEALEQLTGLRTAIRDGDIAIDEAFPAIDRKPAFNVEASPDPKREEIPGLEKQPQAQASPQEGLANLAKGSGIKEETILSHAKEKRQWAADSLADFADKWAKAYINAWHEILPELKAMQEGGAE